MLFDESLGSFIKITLQIFILALHLFKRKYGIFFEKSELFHPWQVCFYNPCTALKYLPVLTYLQYMCMEKYNVSNALVKPNFPILYAQVIGSTLLTFWFPIGSCPVPVTFTLYSHSQSCKIQFNVIVPFPFNTRSSSTKVLLLFVSPPRSYMCVAHNNTFDLTT